MRLAVHTDVPYHRSDDGIYGEHAFTLFLIELAARLEYLVAFGRLDPVGDGGRYPLGSSVDFAPLPHYESLIHLRQVLRAALVSMARFWRLLGRVDAVWLLGPSPLQMGFVVLAALRRRRIILGVRQDTRAYIAHRHPTKRWVRPVAAAMDFAWHALSRTCPVIVVGPELARHYRRAGALLEINASLVTREEIVPVEQAIRRSYDGEPVEILSVGRLETEKNPLILADILAALTQHSNGWRLLICGEGPLRDALANRLAALGLSAKADLLGYVPHGPRLRSLYRESHLFLHASLTEGLPQVLLEAFAAGLPTVATDVGGVGAVGDAAMLVPPGDPAAAAAAIIGLRDDPACRRRLVTAGHRYISDRTIDVECRRVAEFMRRAA